MTEKILTLHPDAGKVGVNISKAKYDLIRQAILVSIQARGEMPFKHLADEVAKRLGGGFDGSIGWYVTTVKLDLEARCLIERIPKRTPQHLRISEK